MQPRYSGKYRLALDINTSAVGLATYLLDDKDGKLIPKSLAHIDVQVFGEPIADPKTGQLKKTVRREVRGIRRQHGRYKQRLKKIAHLFPLLGESSESVSKVQGDAVHRWRAEAVTKKISLAQLLAVFMLMAKNRGYAGQIDKENSKVQEHIDELKTLMAEHSVETLGQLLYSLKEKSNTDKVKLPWKKVSDTGTYAERTMITDEFQLIWKSQATFHTIMSQDETNNPTIKKIFDMYFESNIVKSIIPRESDVISIKDLFFYAIFDQRPIWWDTETIGFCPLETEQYRAPKSHPVFQEFRIEEQLNNLKLIKAKRFLSNEEKEKLRAKMNTQKSVSAKAAYTLLGIENDKFAQDRSHISEKDYELIGNHTLHTIHKLEKDVESTLPEQSHNLFIELLADIDNPALFYLDHWENNEKLIPYFKKYSESIKKDCINFINLLTEKKLLDNLESLKLDKGRASYSALAMTKMLPHMKEGLKAYEAKEKIYIGKQNEDYKLKYVGDSVVQQALHETIKAINYAIKLHGGEVPSQFVIELSREMKLSQKKRLDIETMNNQKQKARKAALIELKANQQTEKNIERYLLLMQQNSLCLYCGESINIEQALSPLTEKDHIIPQGYGGESNMANLALVHRNCNQQKAKRLPLEAFEGTKYADAINKCYEGMKDAKFLKKPYDAYRKETKIRMKNLLLKDSSLFENEFKLRQNNETAWIGRELTAYLKANFNLDSEDRVYVTRGTLTGYLRKQLGLDVLLADIRKDEKKPVFNREGAIMDDGGELHCGSWHEKKPNQMLNFDKRTDHRHHLIDAAVIGLVDRSLFKAATHYYKNEKNFKVVKNFSYPSLDGFLESLSDKKSTIIEPKLISNLRNELKFKLKDYIVWHKQDHFPIDNFFDDFIFSCEPETKKLIRKKYLQDLIPEKDPTFDKVINNLKLIVGNDIKEHIISEFTNRYSSQLSGTENEKLSKALCGNGNSDGIFFPIGSKLKVKKVKVYHKVTVSVGTYKEEFDKSKDITHKTLNVNTISSNQTPKYVLNNNGYACVELIKNDKNEYMDFTFIPLHVFWTDDYQKKLTHDDIERIYKNDIVYYSESTNAKGDFYIVKQLKASENALIGLKTTETNTFEHAVKHKLGSIYIRLNKSNVKYSKIVNSRSKMTDIILTDYEPKSNNNFGERCLT